MCCVPRSYAIGIVSRERVVSVGYERSRRRARHGLQLLDQRAGHVNDFPGCGLHDASLGCRRRRQPDSGWAPPREGEVTEGSVQAKTFYVINPS